MSEIVKYRISKDVQSTTHAISWNIAFDLIDKQRELRTFSKENPEPVFQLNVEILKDSADDEEVDLCIKYLYPADVYVKAVLSYTDNNSNVSHDIANTAYEMIEANEWYDLCKLNSSVICLNQWHLGSYVYFCLKFEFIIIENINNNNNAKPQSTANLQGFFITGLFSDAIIKSCDGKEYKVHKIITSSKSDVLRANFEHGSTECRINVVESPFEADVLEAVLSFIYGDEDSSVNGIPEKVLPAADYYQLLDLKSLCEKELCKKMTIENALEFAQLADLHNAEMLKRSSIQFLSDGVELLVKTKSWAEFESVTMLKTIFENAKCNKEIEIKYYECEFGVI